MPMLQQAMRRELEELNQMEAAALSAPCLEPTNQLYAFISM